MSDDVTTNSIHSKQLSGPNLSREEVHTWLLKFHKASATLDTDSWLDSFFHPSAALQYANLPVIEGRENVRAFFKSVLPRLDKMVHEVLVFDYVAPRIYQSANISYVVKGDSENEQISIPGFAVFSLVEVPGEEQLRVIRAETFLDPGPVMGRMQEVFGG